MIGSSLCVYMYIYIYIYIYICISLQNMKSIGLKVQVHDLQKASISGRVRNALQTATCFPAAAQSITTALVGFERVLRVQQREWHDSSIIFSMRDAIDTGTHIYPNIHTSSTVDLPSQHQIYSELRERENDTYANDLMCTRMLRFFPDSVDCQKHVTHIISKYSIISKTHIHTIVLAHLRALLNQ